MQKKSIPFAVVTNGSQWIIFPAVRTDQVSFSQSVAICFDSLERILGEEIDYFKSLLSRDGVIDGNMSIETIGRNIDQIEERRLKAFYAPKGVRPSNPIYPLLESAVVQSFSDSIIGTDSDLLEKCYVKSVDRTKFDHRIRMHLSKRKPLFSTQPKRPMRKKDSRAFSESIKESERKLRPLAILILGSVGSGKTTFLHYTKNVTAKDFFEKSNDEKLSPHWIQADFRDFAKSENAVKFLYGSEPQSDENVR